MNFQQAIEKIKTLSQIFTDSELLELYGLYKQATIGDINIPKPGFFDFTGKAKWDAWNELKSTNPRIAKTQYITLVEKMMDIYQN